MATTYRPISLTGQLCKVFETVVRVRLLSSWGRMHDAGVRVSPGLKSTYDGLATTPVCMTPT